MLLTRTMQEVGRNFDPPINRASNPHRVMVVCAMLVRGPDEQWALYIGCSGEAEWRLALSVSLYV